MESVMPADEKIMDIVSERNSALVLENTVIVSAINPYQLIRHLTAPITLSDSIKTTAMVDSGAIGNFIHLRFVEEHNLVTQNRSPLTVNDVNGRLLSRVDQQVEIRMTVGNHAETLMFDIALLGGHNIVLRLPWLQQHDPLLHWSSGKVTFISEYCKKYCLAQPTSTFLNQRPLFRPPAITEDPELDSISAEEVALFAIDIPKHLEPLKEIIPEEYWDYLDVFDGERAATTLPEIRGPNIDFAIELDPMKPLPKPS